MGVSAMEFVKQHWILFLTLLLLFKKKGGVQSRG